MDHRSNSYKFAWLLSFSIFALSACSGPDQITPLSGSDAPVDLDGDEDVADLYAYAGSTTLTTNSFTYMYAQGGTSPYTYSLVSGDATVNASSGYVQVFTAGTVSIRVQDAAGATFPVSITVSGTSTSSASCVYLGNKSILAGNTVEARIDLGAYAYLSRHVINGLGVRLQNDNLAGIYAKVSKLNADGSISTSDAYAYKTGDLGSTTKGEIYIDLPAGYFLIGVGLAPNSNGSNLEALRLFGAKVDATGAVTGTVQCYVDSTSRTCTASNVNLSGKSYWPRYLESRSANNAPLVTWGARITSATVGAYDMAAKTIATSTTDTGLCPQ